MMALLALLPATIDELMRRLNCSRRAIHARIRRARRAGYPVVMKGRQPGWIVTIMPRMK